MALTKPQSLGLLYFYEIEAGTPKAERKGKPPVPQVKQKLLDAGLLKLVPWTWTSFGGLKAHDQKTVITDEGREALKAAGY